MVNASTTDRGPWGDGLGGDDARFFPGSVGDGFAEVRAQYAGPGAGAAALASGHQEGDEYTIAAGFNAGARYKVINGVPVRQPDIVQMERIEVIGRRTPTGPLRASGAESPLSAATAAYLQDTLGDGFAGDPYSSFDTGGTVRRMPDAAPELGLRQLGEYLNPITRAQGFYEGFSPIESVKGLVDLVTSPLDTLERAGIAMQESTRRYVMSARQGNFSQAARYEAQVLGSQAAGAAVGVGLGAAGTSVVVAAQGIRAGMRIDLKASPFLADQARSTGASMPMNEVNRLANGGPQVQVNARMGSARERVALAELQNMYPGAQVLRERMLLNADGTKAVDFVSGQGRRVDLVVTKEGKVLDVVEVTSQTASKRQQLAKELRIRDAGGTFVKDAQGQTLLDVSAVPTRVIRLK